MALICPVCLKEVEKFHPRSHIQPEWMYHGVYDENHKALLIELKGAVVKKTQQGLHRELFCQACEVRFGEDDRYASIALGGRSKLAPEYTSVQRRPTNPETQEFTVVDGLDFRKLQRFVFGVVLRGSLACDLTGGESLIVDEHFEALRSLYHENPSLDDMVYPIFIMEAHLTDEYRTIVFLPYRERIDGHNVISFQGAGFNFKLFVSSHSVSQELSLLRLTNKGQIVLMHDSFESSGFLRKTAPAFRKIFDKYGPIVPGKKIRPKDWKKNN